VAATVLLLAAGSVLAGDQELRVFQLHFRPARDATALIEPMLSADGSVMLQPRLNTVTVRDTAEVISRVAQALTSWDVAPVSYRLRVRVLLASTEPQQTGRAGPMISGIGAELARLFHYTAYEEVGTVQVTAADGTTAEMAISERYHMNFALRAVPQDPDRIQLGQLQLSRRDKGPDNQEILRPLLRATVNLVLRQPSVLGGARSENANQALFLVLWADHEESR
jgi:hypothetical protein